MKRTVHNIVTRTSIVPRRVWVVSVLTTALLIANILLGSKHGNSFFHISKQSVSDSSRPFSWSDITPSISLTWNSCFDGGECARLDVPLDWTNATKHKSKRAAIALFRLPARVPVTDPRYGGAILINPGGPGGSGVFFAKLAGRQLQLIADTPISPSNSTGFGTEAKYFDIIGFDPRGVNNTTPIAHCFPDDVSANTFMFEARTEGLVKSNESFANAWARSSAVARSCNARMEGVGEFVGTRSVVEDMRAMIDALGEWRARQTAELGQSTLQRDKEKILYWGFSYGTLLGATFAAVYPDRIERMVLDGVVDAEDYYNTSWLANLQDADLILEKFFEDCYNAGADCAIYSPSGIDAIRKTYYDSVDSLQDNPLSMPAYGDYGPQIITYDDIMMIVNIAIRSPWPGFSILAMVVHELTTGVSQFMAQLKSLMVPNMCPLPLCKPWSKECHDSSTSTSGSITFAVLCGDGKDITDKGRDFHWQKWQQLYGQSKVLGGMWSQLTMPCSNWNLRSVWNSTGTITAPNGTSHPIVWMSNTRDPVTPLRNARNMAAKFPGSVVFGQDADGHSTLAAPSTCVALATRHYFQTGEPPKAGFSCKPDRRPFDFGQISGTTSENMELMQAMKELSKARQRFDLL